MELYLHFQCAFIARCLITQRITFTLPSIHFQNKCQHRIRTIHIIRYQFMLCSYTYTAPGPDGVHLRSTYIKQLLRICASARGVGFLPWSQGFGSGGVVKFLVDETGIRQSSSVFPCHNHLVIYSIHRALTYATVSIRQAHYNILVLLVRGLHPLSALGWEHSNLLGSISAFKAQDSFK